MIRVACVMTKQEYDDLKVGDKVTYHTEDHNGPLSVLCEVVRKWWGVRIDARVIDGSSYVDVSAPYECYSI